MPPVRYLMLTAAVLSLSSCGADPSGNDPTGPAASAPSQSVAPELGAREASAGIPDSIQKVLSGALVRLRGGVGTPGSTRSILVGPRGDTLISEVTRGPDGRIARLQTIRAGTVITESTFRTEGLVSIGTHRSGSSPTLEFRSTNADQNFAGPIQFQQQQPPPGEDECTIARASYALAYANLLLILFTWPLDPTPFHYVALVVAQQQVAAYQTWMNYVCTGDPH
jgi:hypothetical protein